MLTELVADALQVSRGSSCVLFDTLVGNMPVNLCPERPWGQATARRQRLMNTCVATLVPDGYLKRVD